MSENKQRLFDEFQSPTTQEWLDKIQVDLKGADFNKRLVWRTNEGFNVQPFYRREDVLKLKTPDSLPGEFPFVRGNKKDDNTWYVRQDIKADDAAAANAKALDILNKGVDSLGFRIPGDKVSKEFVETLLDNIVCECVEVNFSTCLRHAQQLAEILVEYFKEKGYDPEKLVGSIDFDPIEKMMMKGRDTSELSAQEVRTAALETLAENLSDGVIAPLFWLAVLGVPGMMAYKMVNTLDSMIGYKTERYREFGCWPAHIDDVVNYLPARLTALLMVLATGRLSLLRFVWRYGSQHASPNSGYPEAALAGTLDCRFGGPHYYFGQLFDKPYIGENDRPLTTADMKTAVRVNRTAEILMVALTTLRFLI